MDYVHTGMYVSMLIGTTNKCINCLITHLRTQYVRTNLPTYKYTNVPNVNCTCKRNVYLPMYLRTKKVRTYLRFYKRASMRK